MAYKIRIKKSAKKELTRLSRPAQRKVVRAIDKLADNPRCSMAEKITGGEGSYRIRAGDYRIIYRIFDDEVVVFVIAIGHRREIYRNI